jgi:GNAT superfamily N-acetyltransferase
METSTEAIRVSLCRSPEQQLLLDKAHGALREFFTSRPAGPIPRSAWMGDGYIEASVFNNRVRLSAIFVMPELRGRHLGSEYLKAFLEVIDRHGVEVEGTVAPFGDKVPETKKGVRELTKWYKAYGFVPVKGRKGYMVRPAASQPTHLSA